MYVRTYERKYVHTYIIENLKNITLAITKLI